MVGRLRSAVLSEFTNMVPSLNMGTSSPSISSNTLALTLLLFHMQLEFAGLIEAKSLGAADSPRLTRFRVSAGCSSAPLKLSMSSQVELYGLASSPPSQCTRHCSAPSIDLTAEISLYVHTRSPCTLEAEQGGRGGCQGWVSVSVSYTSSS